MKEGLTNWDVDERAIEEALRQSSVGVYLEQQAQAGVRAAQNLAPVLTGRYRDSIHVVPAHLEDGQLVAGFGSNLYYWHIIEFGSWRQPGLYVLQRAGESIAHTVEFE